jgi:palmitoyltransferase
MDMAVPANMCSIGVIVVVGVLALPILGLLGFHINLVARGRTTNEQVTGKFASGYNPFDMSFWRNCVHALCYSQYPT